MLETLGDLTVEFDDLSVASETLIDTVLEAPVQLCRNAQALPLPDVAWIFALEPSSPCRHVDWRWKVAARLVKGSVVSDSWVDQQVRKASFFQRQLHKASTADQERLSQHVPGFFAAYSLYEQGPDLFRAEVEARILARESFSSIAQKTCLSVAAIATYEAIFFNVLDRLDSPSYITHKVFGPQIHEGLKPSDIDVLWKFFGYHGGSLALDALIYGHGVAERPTAAADVGWFFAADIQVTAAQKAAVAARTMKLDDPKAFQKLIRMYQRLVVLRQECSSASPQVDISANLQAFVAGLPYELNISLSGVAGSDRSDSLIDSVRGV